MDGFLEGKPNRTVPKRSETKQILCYCCLELAKGLRIDMEHTYDTHTHTQRVRLIQQAPVIHALSAPQEALAVSSPSSTSSIQVQIGTETHINPWPPASIEILAPNANATPLSLCKHQHHAHTMLEL